MSGTAVCGACGCVWCFRVVCLEIPVARKSQSGICIFITSACRLTSMCPCAFVVALACADYVTGNVGQSTTDLDTFCSSHCFETAFMFIRRCSADMTVPSAPSILSHIPLQEKLTAAKHAETSYLSAPSIGGCVVCAMVFYRAGCQLKVEMGAAVVADNDAGGARTSYAVRPPSARPSSSCGRQTEEAHEGGTEEKEWEGSRGNGVGG